MHSLENLSDDEIDDLLLLLFNGAARPTIAPQPKSIHEFSDADLLRARSKNHPDKWPNANVALYQAVVEEIDRRRSASS